MAAALRSCSCTLAARALRAGNTSSRHSPPRASEPSATRDAAISGRRLATSEDLQQLLKHLAIEKVHLVAIAHGAFFALDFALEYPQQVISLTIASSLMGIDESELDYAQANERLRPKQFAALPNEFKELHPSYRVGNPAGLAAWIKLADAAMPGLRISPKRRHVLTWARLESIKIPTLLITGDGDLYTPPALLRMQAAHMSNAEVVIVAEAGHCANWEQPVIFNQTVLTFLRKHKA